MGEAPLFRTPRRRFTAWRVVLWLVLLAATFGGAQYLGHLHLLWQARPGVAAAEQPALLRMLVWDGAYLAIAFVLIVLAAGCILRLAWARAPMRGMAVLLALWALASGGLMLADWQDVEQSVASVLAVGDTHQATLAAGMRRSYRVALGLKALAIPVLLWLAWKLGAGDVRAAFRRR